MPMNRLPIFLLSAAVSVSAFAADQKFQSALGLHFNPGSAVTRIAPKKGLDALHRWNEIALNASGLDHTPVAPSENRVFGEQFGPGRSSRAMAIVHIAIFDAVNAIVGGYTSYTGVQATHGPISMDAVIAQVAHDTLIALYPSQAASFDS
jgi:hypothetical protein